MILVFRPMGRCPSSEEYNVWLTETARLVLPPMGRCPSSEEEDNVWMTETARRLLQEAEHDCRFLLADFLQ
jgi:hypothetical protein